MVDPFAGGPTVNEKFSESLKTPKDPLADLDGKKLERDGGGIYGNFKSPEECDEPPKIEGSSNSKKSTEQARKIFNSFQRDRLKTRYGDNVKDSSGNDIYAGEITKEQKDRNEQLRNKPQNIKALISDIPEVKKIPKLESFDFTVSESKSTFESEVLNKIGGNYIKTPNEKSEFDVEVDFSLAILETRSQIEKDCANINETSETYKVAINNIDSNDIARQLEGIESLYILAYSNEGRLGKTTLDKYKKNRKEKLINEAKDIDKKLKSGNSENDRDKLEKRKEQIKREMSELTGLKDGEPIKDGDIFASSKIESGSESVESNIKED